MGVVCPVERHIVLVHLHDLDLEGDYLDLTTSIVISMLSIVSLVVPKSSDAEDHAVF